MIALIVGLGLIAQIVSGGVVTIPSDATGSVEFIIEQLNNSVSKSVEEIESNIKNYTVMMKSMTDKVVEENMQLLSERIQSFKNELAQAKKSVVVDCMIEEGQLDVLEEQVNEEVRECTTKVLTEVVNVISDSLNQAQEFMSVPEVIGKDIEKCGFSNECMKTIVEDAIEQSLLIPNKVMIIAAKIQQLNLRTVTSIDACMLESIKKVTHMGFSIIEDVMYCIEDSIDDKCAGKEEDGDGTEEEDETEEEENDDEEE